MPSVLSVPIAADITAFTLISRVLKENRQPPSTQYQHNLIPSLVRSGHIAHGRLTEAFGKDIKLDQIHKFVDYLEENYFNHVTSSGQIKRNFQFDDEGDWLCLETMTREFSVFDRVINSLLGLTYVDSIGFSATLTLAYGAGTDHTDRQNFVIRLIFTFILERGANGAKVFIFRHGNKRDSMKVRTHEFVAIDATGSGRELFEEKLVSHQALANASEIFTVTLSLFGENIPPLPQVMADWEKSGSFTSYGSSYLTD